MNEFVDYLCVVFIVASISNSMLQSKNQNQTKKKGITYLPWGKRSSCAPRSIAKDVVVYLLWYAILTDDPLRSEQPPRQFTDFWRGR